MADYIAQNAAGIAALVTALGAVAGYLVDRRQRSASVSQSISNATNDMLDAAEKVRDMLMEQIATQDSQIKAQAMTLQAVSAQVGAQQSEIADLRLTVRGQAERIADLERDNRTLSERVAELERENGRLREALAVEKGRTTRLQGKLRELGQQVDTGPLKD